MPRVLLVLFLVALILRLPVLGQSAISFDEQYYLLVADRMLAGAVPYVDIWDRKPIGLFLLFAAARMVGGAGVIGYQLLAFAFALATAFLIQRLGRRQAGETGALLAGCAYLLWLDLCGGAGGQAAVFFNLLMAGAAALVLPLVGGGASGRTLLWRGAGAMLFAGCAIQVKYTALFEALFFGLALMWIAARALGPVRALGLGFLWAGLALLPTGLALLAWWRMGALDAFLFANFLSIANRGDIPSGETLRRFAILALMLGPLVALALARAQGMAGKALAERRFLRSWLVVALLAVLALGSFYDHQGQPVLLPACIAAAPALAAWRRRPIVIGLFGTAALAMSVVNLVDARLLSRTADQAARALRGSRNCPFIFEGPPIPYQLGGWCLPTRWPFPNHLSYRPERDALGVDAASEVRRIMARRPDRVVLFAAPPMASNAETRGIVRAALARDYRLAARPGGSLEVWALRPGRTPLPNAVLDLGAGGTIAGRKSSPASTQDHARP